MITVIGMDGSPLTPPAASAVGAATLVVGAPRHLAAVPARQDAQTVALGELRPALATLSAHEGDAVVLASGDPGFFGIVRALRENGLACVVLPAVSSVALAFARAGLPWDDAVVASAHGRDLRRAVNLCRAYPKVGVLTGPGAGPGEIGAALAGWPRRLIVCERLGSHDECISECTPATASRRCWQEPNVVLALAARTPGPGGAHVSPARTVRASPAGVIMSLVSPERHQTHDHENESSNSGHTEHSGFSGHGSIQGERLNWVWPLAAAGGPVTGAGWALPEDSFDTRGAVITKAEVRALALARLAPSPGTLIWDVGAGAGTVAVECARFGAAVIAIECDDLRCGLVRSNAGRYGVDVRVISGTAPAALAGLPEPDAVFVGGGGIRVIQAVAARRPARIVVAMAAVERAGQALGLLADAGYPVDGALVQTTRLAPLPGGVHRLSGTNPVFLIWAAAAGGPGPAPGSAAEHEPAAAPGPGAAQ